MTEGLLLSLLFALVAVSAALVPIFLGIPFAVLISAVCGGLIVGVAFAAARQTQARLPSESRAVNLNRLGLAALFAVGLCLLGGEGHFFYANTDWLYRDAVLHDLSMQPWPVLYRFHDQTWLLRAPLGMYMLPALAGKAFGFYAAELALFAQNSLIFTLIFYFLVPVRSTSRAALIILGVVCIYGGWSIAGVALKYAATGKVQHIDRIEWWAGFFQYSSSLTQIFWVPNHAIPGWVFACLFLKWIRREVGTGLVLSVVPLFAFWSPLTALGMVPFAAYVGISALFRRSIALSDIAMVVCAIVAAVPMLIYEQLNAASVPHRFLWNDEVFPTFYVFFILFEVLPTLALIYFAPKRPSPDTPTWLIMTVLLAIPFYSLGVNNDFAMRASIPALVVLAASLGVRCTLAQGRAWMGLAILSLILGGVTPWLEIHRALSRSVNPPGPCNLIQVWQADNAELPLTHYITPVETLPANIRAGINEASAAPADSECETSK